MGFHLAVCNDECNDARPRRRKTPGRATRDRPMSKPGSVIGVGTGSTVAYFIDALGAIAERSNRPCRARSKAHARLKEHGIRVVDLNSVGDVVALRRRRGRMRSATMPDQGRRRSVDARENRRRGIEDVRLHDRCEQTRRCTWEISAADRSDSDGARAMSHARSSNTVAIRSGATA